MLILETREEETANLGESLEIIEKIVLTRIEELAMQCIKAMAKSGEYTAKNFSELIGWKALIREDKELLKGLAKH